MSNVLETVLFLGMFFLATLLCIPKAIHFWSLWKKSGKAIHLSNAFAMGALAIFFLAGDLVMFLQAVCGFSKC